MPSKDSLKNGSNLNFWIYSSDQLGWKPLRWETCRQRSRWFLTKGRFEVSRSQEGEGWPQGRRRRRWRRTSQRLSRFRRSLWIPTRRGVMSAAGFWGRWSRYKFVLLLYYLNVFLTPRFSGRICKVLWAQGFGNRRGIHELEKSCIQ